ncbi:MAG TPA: DUF1269 domain-containing protein [Polyangiaceae bacterium]|jgi:uncharacterized membrane protein
METKDPRYLLVLAFDSPLKSREAFIAFQRLALDNVVAVHDAVFFDKDDKGHVAVNETIDPQVGSTAAGSGLWGALLGTLVAGPIGTLLGAATSAGFGALAAKLIDIGIPDATVKEIEEATPPSSSALALLLSHINEGALEEELKRFSGSTLVRSDLDPMAVQRLRNALTKSTAAAG